MAERDVRRLLQKLAAEGDRAVVHGLGGRSSNRKLSLALRDKIVAVLSQERYSDYGPMLAAAAQPLRGTGAVGR